MPTKLLLAPPLRYFESMHTCFARHTAAGGNVLGRVEERSAAQWCVGKIGRAMRFRQLAGYESCQMFGTRSSLADFRANGASTFLPTAECRGAPRHGSSGALVAVHHSERGSGQTGVLPFVVRPILRWRHLDAVDAVRLRIVNAGSGQAEHRVHPGRKRRLRRSGSVRRRRAARRRRGSISSRAKDTPTARASGSWTS